MGDIDGQTFQWLQSLKLGQKLEYISDFQNGYYLGLIFDRLNLAKGRKFKNTEDMACKFHNYKNIRDLLLQNFNVDFPINNILFSTEQLLRTIRECILKYNKDKKQATLKRIQTFSQSKIQPQEQRLFASRQKDILLTSKQSQTTKFPKKIQQIEHKLQKYRQIKTKHELIALQDRKRQIQENRSLVEEHRSFEINKLRTNHQFTKQHQRKVYDVWMKTEQIKKARIEKDTNLKNFLDEKKNKMYQSLRDQESKSFKDGLEAFQLNCIRQGIQLEHDPDKPLRKTEESFNKQVIMQRIKDNMKNHQRQRKQRIKRQNKKAVDAKQANIKSQMLWNENNLVENYANKMNSHIVICSKIKMAINRQQAEKIAAIQKKKNKVFKELPQSKIDMDQWNQQYRSRKIQYLDEQVQRLQRRQKKHKALAHDALEALIHIVVANQQAYSQKGGFSFLQWKQVERQFLVYQKSDKKAKDQSKFIDSSYQNIANDYIACQGVWKSTEPKGNNLKLSQIVSSIISTGYPEQKATEKLNVPLYMPLKIGFVGNSLSGKTALSQRLAQKYGILYINPLAIITQAFQLNKEPVPEDPKKKKDLKKPEEENPEKLALKEWGQKIIKKISSPANATIQHFIEAIQFKLKYNFQNKVGEEIIKQFQQSKVQETQRYNKALKQFEELQKKGKKDPKKVQQSDEPPSERKYFYTKGFALDGIDLSLEQLKKIQKRINGFLAFEQKVNQQAETIKQSITNIINVPKAVKDQRLTKGFFDLLIQLDVGQQILQNRQSGEKKKITKKDYLDAQKFYANFGNENTKQKAYKKIKNEHTIQQSLVQISQIVEKHLDDKYIEITSFSKTESNQTEEKAKDNESIQQEVLVADKQICSALIKKLSKLYSNYSSKISESFSDIDNLRQEFQSNLMAMQQNFINIINRPDDKAGRILNFQENYNKLHSQKANIVKDQQASKHLISKLDELYNSLWVSLEGKKNEAVAERQKVLQSNLLNCQVEKIVQVSKNLLQNELNLLMDIIFFIYRIRNASEGVNDQLSPQYLVLGIPKNAQPIGSFDKQEFGSPRLDYYLKQFNNCLEQLPQKLFKIQKRMKIAKQKRQQSEKDKLFSQILKDFIDKRKEAMLRKVKGVKQRIKQFYLEYFCSFSVLVNKMDDWIIQGIKFENQFVYDIYKNMKKNIQEARRCNVKDLFVKDITELIHPMQSLPLTRLPVVLKTNTNHYKIQSYVIFLQQVRCLSTNGRIPYKLFQSYFQKRKKSRLLQDQFLKIQLDIVQQYLVTDQFCTFREVALALLLWNVKVLEEDSINDYQDKLKLKGESIQLEDLEVIPGIAGDIEEQRILNTILFQIFRQDYQDTLIVKQLGDTLRVFAQLQVYRYGDTLMMLHQGAKR